MGSDREALAQFFREVILPHALEPVGRDATIDATHRAELDNPLCGDHVVIELIIDGEQVKAAGFTAEACSVCMAACSLVCTHVPGMTVAELADTESGFKKALDQERAPCPDYLVDLLGLKAFPARKACATLPWEAAVKASRA